MPLTMKRDPEMMCSILEGYLERQPGASKKSFWSPHEKANLALLEQIELMCMDGLLSGHCSPNTGYAIIHGVTKTGEDFLRAARSPEKLAWLKEQFGRLPGLGMDVIIRHLLGT